MEDIIELRHNPHAQRQNVFETAMVPADFALRARHRDTGISSFHNCFFGTSRISSLPIRHAVAYSQYCEDLFPFTLNGASHTLLTGNSPVRNTFRDSIINFVAGNGVPVLILSAAPNDSCYRDDIHKLDTSFFSPGYRPFFNWSEERAVRCFQSFLLAEDECPSPHYVSFIRLLLQVMAQDNGLWRDIKNGRVTNFSELVDYVGQRQDLGCTLDSFRGDILLTNRVLGMFYNFFSMFKSDQVSYEWSVFTPGITVATIQSNQLTSCTGKWYLQRMAPYLEEDLEHGETKLFLVLDRIEEDDIRPFKGLIQNRNTTLLVISESVLSIPQDIRGMLSDRFVFSQSDQAAAQYWAALTGERQVMLNDWTSTRAVTRSFLHFPSHTTSNAIHRGIQFRPNYEASDFASLDKQDGFLFRGGADNCSFHRFHYDE